MHIFGTDSDSPPSWAGSLTNLKILKVSGFLIGLLILRACLISPEPESGDAPQESSPLQVEMSDPTPLGILYGPPTPQRLWRELDNPRVYMPTGSGRVASASYGSVRTQSSGRASFHEGVDIAPVRWERGRAQDPISAAADGEVAYINRIAGNSSYGRYVVLRHEDALGDVYTLYAHLASVDPSLSTGSLIRRGDTLGVMGHSSTLGIPRQRSHLHFELCLMLNPDFHRWYRGQNLSPDHQAYHGYNLAGLNPHLLLSTLHEREEVPFSFAHAVTQTETAWTVLVRTRQKPRYFDHYPTLWSGGPPEYGAVILNVSESGAVLSGRPAALEQADRLGRNTTEILEVIPEALGRNGLRHIQKRGDTWQLARNGERWLEILLYRP
jgi:murein DD-endopeptidase MepM/ murein hydrolase activator NlpD